AVRLGLLLSGRDFQRAGGGLQISASMRNSSFSVRHERIHFQHQEEISDGKDGDEKEGGLPFPHWICQPYVRPAPKPPMTNGTHQESQVRKVCQKRALEDSDKAAEGLSKNKQKKRSRNPNKNFCPELKREFT
ncbi:hypothetical protein XENOCAPTIV_017570, partial [Xenoophorus captivus]